MRLAFVGYRDFGDEVRFEVLDFTPSVGDFYNFCDKIVATGGADSPEDVFGGLERSIALNWTKGLCGFWKFLFKYTFIFVNPRQRNCNIISE